MTPYATLRADQRRRSRYQPGAGMPRFAHFVSTPCLGLSKGVKGWRTRSDAGNAIALARHRRLLSVAARLRPLPPLVGERHKLLIRRWREI